MKHIGNIMIWPIIIPSLVEIAIEGIFDIR